MKNKINSIAEQLKNEIRDVKDLETIKQLRATYIGKSELLNELKESIKTVENKAEVGQNINMYTTSINEILNTKKEEIENTFDLGEKVNIPEEETTLSKSTGYDHPLNKISNIVHNFFEKHGFEYERGIEIETEKFNFDALNLPANHPARTMQDTFYLEGGKLLRTHSTNVTARALAETTESEFKSYSIGTVFRNDENDATHSFQFNQIDIFQIGKDISVANLKWTIDNILKSIFEDELDIRFRPSYFPFTEPSFEVDIKRSTDKDWIEVLGCGMIHPNVIKSAGKNPEEIQGYAAGLGLERLAMLKYEIKDIREFFNNEIDFLKEVK